METRNSDMKLPSPSSLRNYLYEYVLMAFAVAIVALFMLYKSLNTYIINNLTQQNERALQVIEQNNNFYKSAIIELKTK